MKEQRLARKASQKNCYIMLDKVDIQEVLVHIYENYSPEQEHDISEKGSKMERLKQKVENGDHAGGVRVALKDFHPHRNHEEKVGFERHVICEKLQRW